MLLKLGEIIERINFAQDAGMDQAHEEIPDVGPVLGLVEKRIFPMQDDFLQCPFTQVVVQWRIGFS